MLRLQNDDKEKTRVSLHRPEKLLLRFVENKQNGLEIMPMENAHCCNFFSSN